MPMGTNGCNCNSASEHLKFSNRYGGSNVRMLSGQSGTTYRIVQDTVQSWLIWKLAQARTNFRDQHLSIADVYLMPGGLAWDGGNNIGLGADPFLPVVTNQYNYPNFQPKDYFIPDTNYDTTLVWVPVQGV